MLIGFFTVAYLVGTPGLVAFAAGMSLLALRELLSLMPWRQADRHAHVIAFAGLALQYAWVIVGWYGMLVIFLPPANDAPRTEALPRARPDGWDPGDFNLTRGRAGAIPDSCMAKIEAPDGITNHLGKHLPYVPPLPDTPQGARGLMWGDASLGYARHPNAAPDEGNPEGHRYNWIRVRKATDDDAEEVESRFSGWPTVGDADTGRYLTEGDGPVTDDGGRNTVYVAALPADVQPGDWVRVHGHGLTHGEYVDFVQVPA